MNKVLSNEEVSFINSLYEFDEDNSEQALWRISSDKSSILSEQIYSQSSMAVLPVHYHFSFNIS